MASIQSLYLALTKLSLLGDIRLFSKKRIRLYKSRKVWLYKSQKVFTTHFYNITRLFFGIVFSKT